MKNFIALLIFFGGLGAWYVYHDMNKTRSWIQDVTELTRQLEQKVTAQKASQAVVNQARAAQQRAQELRTAVSAVTAKQKVLNEEKASLSRRQQTAKSGNRQGLLGTVLTDVTLADGRKFAQAKVTKIDDASVSFLIPSGVVRVNSRDLPPELQKLFLFAR